MTLFATFRVGERQLGLDILRVREIIRVLDITPVPLAEPRVRGLLNLRGQIVTILDLAVSLGDPRPEISEGSHIVILKQGGPAAGEGTAGDLRGLLVDGIGDVVEADDQRLELPPANLEEAGERFVSGVLRREDGLLVVLRLQEVLAVGGSPPAEPAA